MVDDVSVSEQVLDLNQYAVHDDADSVDSQSAMDFNNGAMYSYEQRIQTLEAEVIALKEALQMMPDAQNRQREEFRKKMAELDGFQVRMKEVLHATSESNRAVNNMEKRVDGVKNYATLGVVSSVLVFSVMLIVALVMRSQ